ncbi:MAG: hypothetical protein ABIJ39_09060 [Chloroflexota bacterium]
MQRFPIKVRHVVILIGIIILMALLVDFNRRTTILRRQEVQLATVRYEGTAVMRTQEALHTRVAEANSGDLAVEYGYEAGMTRPEETPVGIVPAGVVTPTRSPEFQTQDEEVPIWQIWWELFFGDR